MSTYLRLGQRKLYSFFFLLYNSIVDQIESELMMRAKKAFYKQ